MLVVVLIANCTNKYCFLGEGVFADWFEFIYVPEAWDNGCFFAGAAGAPGMPNHNQCDESLNRSIKRFVITKASVEHWIGVSIPDMLQHFRLHYSFRTISRGAVDQLHRIKTGHIHRDVLEKAQCLVLASEKNMPPQSAMRNGVRHYMWYINSSHYHYEEFGDLNAVTKTRIAQFKKLVPGLTVAEFGVKYLSMHVVRQLDMTVDGVQSYRLVCDCANFWNCNVLCAHILAVYHTKNRVNIWDLLSKLMATRKRGRPTNREKALERDKDIDVMSLRPQDWRGSSVYDPLHGHGKVFSYRPVPENGGIVWNIRFLQSPDGVVGIDGTGVLECEMNPDEFRLALDLHRQWEKRASRTDMHCA
jgi:hypothetical protein